MTHVVKEHRFNLDGARGAAKKRAFFGKHFFFHKRERTATQNDHHIGRLQLVIPQMLQKRWQRRITFSHIRKLIEHHHLLTASW